MAKLLIVLVILVSVVGFLFFGPQDFFKNLSNPIKISEDIPQIKNVQEGIQGITKQASESIETTKKTIDTKIEQIKKVQESVEKVGGSINELKQNVSSLTDFSGSTGSTGIPSYTGNANTQTKK